MLIAAAAEAGDVWVNPAADPGQQQPPEPYSAKYFGLRTIREALDFAEPGDTIWVAGGFTYPPFEVKGKTSLDIQGEWWSDVAPPVVRGDGTGTVVSVESVEGLRIASFEITGGGGEYGAGMRISGSSDVSIEDCRIHANNATAVGGGIGIYQCQRVNLAGNRIWNNRALGGEENSGGGGVGALEVEGLAIMNNEIGPQNEAVLDGGGVYARKCSHVWVAAPLEGFVKGNLAGPEDVLDAHDQPRGHGAGLCFVECYDVRIEQVVIEDNRGTRGGGVAVLDGCDKVVFAPEVEVLSNLARKDGGGVYVRDSGTPGSPGVEFDGTEIKYNVGDDTGGGLWARRSRVMLREVKCLRNTSDNGGGIAIFHWPYPGDPILVQGGEVSDNWVLPAATPSVQPFVNAGGGVYIKLARVDLTGVKVIGNQMRTALATLVGSELGAGGGVGVAVEGPRLPSDTEVDIGVGLGPDLSLLIAPKGTVPAGLFLVRLYDCNIEGNRSLDDDAAGVMSLNGGEVRVEGCTLQGNVARQDGGGLYVHSISSLVLGSDNTIRDNRAETGNGGGGQVASKSELNVEGAGNVFDLNLARKDGGGLYGYNSTLRVGGDAGVAWSDNACQDGEGGGIAWQAIPLFDSSSLPLLNQAIDDLAKNKGLGGTVRAEFIKWMQLAKTLFVRTPAILEARGDVRVEDNIAGLRGGGLAFSRAMTVGLFPSVTFQVELRGVEIRGNRCLAEPDEGNGVSFTDGGPRARVLMDNCSFRENGWMEMKAVQTDNVGIGAGPAAEVAFTGSGFSFIGCRASTIRSQVFVALPGSGTVNRFALQVLGGQGASRACRFEGLGVCDFGVIVRAGASYRTSLGAFEGFATYAYRHVSDRSYTEARACWWDSPSGPRTVSLGGRFSYPNPGGAGEWITDNVAWDPFLTSAP